MMETRFVQSVTKRCLSVGAIPALSESRSAWELNVVLLMACLLAVLYCAVMVEMVSWYAVVTMSVCVAGMGLGYDWRGKRGGKWILRLW